jgi:hypothetical protein
MQVKEGGGPGHGLFPADPLRAFVHFEDDVSQWDVVVFDLDNTNSGSYVAGGDAGASVWNTVRDPAAGTSNGHLEKKFGIYAVAEEAQAADSTGWVTVRGHTTVGSTGTIVAGDWLVAPLTTTNVCVVANGTTDSKAIAVAEAGGSGSTIAAYFDGLTGFGMDTTT